MTQTRHPTIIFLRTILPFASLLFASLILSACGGILYTPTPAADYCGIDPALLEPETAAEAEGKTVIELWTSAERYYCMRAYAPLITAHQRPDLALAVRVNNLEINSNPLTDRLLDLAANGEAPDIAFVSYANAVRLGEAGHLYPLEECMQRAEFQHIPDPFWHSFSVDRRPWGIPMESEFLLLFYNKELLRKLGWSKTQIDELPMQIFNGTYTMQDMVATAKEAIDANVVPPGLAFIPSRGQHGTIMSLYIHGGGRFMNDERNQFMADRAALAESYSFLVDLHKHNLFDRRLAMRRFGDWSNKLLLRDAANHNRLLFWNEVTTEWQRIATDYAKTSNDAAALRERIGIALLPAMADERGGHTSLIYSGQYVIFAQQATGRSNQVAACDLLAATHTSGLLKEHAEKSGYITFSSEGIYLPSWFPTDLPAEELHFFPPVLTPEMDAYRDILAETGVLVERGELSADEAADVAIERLRDAFGEQLIVE